MQAWWQGASLYQIYPRSYYDTTGNGVGDLNGIIEKLPYIKALEVDGVWLSPFYPSPMKDFGYDVSDYCGVEPLFGSLADFDSLVEKMRQHNLRLVIDLVLSHTSDQHPWFKESRSSRHNPKADWYVWADANADGTAPNNWLSIFGGSAWQWDSQRRQYYLHNFLRAQPDLNFHQPAVRQAVLAVAEFWLKRGVSGFRLDTVNFYYHDQALRSNPGGNKPLPMAGEAVNPYFAQYHTYDKNRPENLTFLADLRRLLDAHPQQTSIGEVGAEERCLEIIKDYTETGKHLHMAYGFEPFALPLSAAAFAALIKKYDQQLGAGWICWAFSNHDVERALSRFEKKAPPQLQTRFNLAKLLLALLATLRGSFCIYQGEELALTEADLPFEALVDPYGIEMYPKFKGRDGCRTPMVWEADRPHGGFSKAVKTWLPVPAEHRAQAVSEQLGKPNSALSFYQKFLAWRKTKPALLRGAIRVLAVEEPVLIVERRLEAERWVVGFNFSPQPVQVKQAQLFGGADQAPSTFTLALGENCRLSEAALQLSGYGFAFLSAT